MQLYSKRYNTRALYSRSVVRINEKISDERPVAIISDTLRNRLQSEVKYIIENTHFIERFLVIFNEETRKNYLNKEELSKLSLQETGADITSILNCKNITFTENYSDAKFFDLIEILLIFSKEEERSKFIERILYHFNEETTQFDIHDFMITSKDRSGLKTVVPLIKDPRLKKKLETYYDSALNSDNEVLARVSIDIIQILFSDEIKDTKTYSTDLCRKIASKWTSPDKIEELANLISDNVMNAKKMSNQIGNIRHTEKFTIPVENPTIYKIIAQNNIAIVELVILSQPEEYVINQKSSALKKTYLEKYNIDSSMGLIEKVKKLDDINLDEIPF